MSVRVLQGSGTDIIEYSLVDGSVNTISLGGSISVNAVGLYNAMDDMVYWIGNSGQRVVKWNPRTDAIVLDQDLSTHGTFMDVVGEYLWFSSGSDGKAVRCSDFSLAFTMPNLFVDYSGYSFPLFAPGGRVVMQLLTDLLTLRLLTSTGGSSFSDEEITFPTSLVVGVANSAELQRPYIYTGDKMYVAGGIGGPGSAMGAIINLATRVSTVVNNPGDRSYNPDSSPRWDAHANAVTFIGNDSVGGLTKCVVVDVASSAIIGTCGGGDYADDQPHPAGDGTVIIFNNSQHAGIFDLEAPSSTPTMVVPGDDFLFDHFDGYTVVPSAFVAFWHEFVICMETP